MDVNTYSHKDGESPASHFRLIIHISEYTSHHGDGSAAKGTAEEPEHQERRPVGRKAARYREGAERGKGQDAECSPPQVFAQGTPDQRPEDVADEVNGDGEHGLLPGCDVKVGGNLWDGHAGKSGPHC